MSWEEMGRTDIRCSGCGRLGSKIIKMDDWNRTRDDLTGGFQHGGKIHPFKERGRFIVCPTCPPETQIEVVEP